MRVQVLMVVFFIDGNQCKEIRAEDMWVPETKDAAPAKA